MKKIVSVLSTVGLALSLAACTPGNTTKTTEYRPLQGNQGSTTGYALQPKGDGRYTTYHNGVITDQSNYRTKGTVDTRQYMFGNQGMTRYGVTNSGQQMYGLSPNGINKGTTYGTTYGTTHQNSVYQSKSTTGHTTPPKIGIAHAGHKTGTGSTYTGMGVKSYGTAATPNVYVDRQMLASSCANAANQIPGVRQANVLTTDKQVFVGCDTSGQTPAQAAMTLKKVQKSCENVSPRYCKVYTTNDQNTINKVFANPYQMENKTDKQFEQIIGHRTGSPFHLSSISGK